MVDLKPIGQLVRNISESGGAGRRSSSCKFGENMRRSYTIGLTVAAGALAFASVAARGATLITINDSNPSAVTFTATGNAPGITDSSHTFAQGLGFAGFFGANPTAGFFPSITAAATSLSTGVDGTPNYTGAQSANFSGSPTDDLQLFAASGNSQDFHAGSSAFTGAATFNFAAGTFYSAGILPAAGTTGQLYSGAGGFFQASPVALGTYVVTSTPEPTSLAILGLAGLTLLARRRHRPAACH